MLFSTQDDGLWKLARRLLTAARSEVDLSCLGSMAVDAVGTLRNWASLAARLKKEITEKHPGTCLCLRGIVPIQTKSQDSRDRVEIPECQWPKMEALRLSNGRGKQRVRTEEGRDKAVSASKLREWTGLTRKTNQWPTRSRKEQCKHKRASSLLTACNERHKPGRAVR